MSDAFMKKVLVFQCTPTWWIALKWVCDRSKRGRRASVWLNMSRQGQRFALDVCEREKRLAEDKSISHWSLKTAASPLHKRVLKTYRSGFNQYSPPPILAKNTSRSRSHRKRVSVGVRAHAGHSSTGKASLQRPAGKIKPQINIHQQEALIMLKLMTSTNHSKREGKRLTHATQTVLHRVE